MHESIVEVKLEKELEDLIEIRKELEECVQHEFKKDIDERDTKDLGEVIDMIKDTYEAEEKKVKSCYYKQLMCAMEEAEYGEDYDEDGPIEHRRYYRGQPRDSRGRYTSRRRGFEMGEPYMHMNEDQRRRDMDMNDGRMYNPYDYESQMGGRRSGSKNTGGSRYGYSYDKYMESKKQHRKDEPEGKHKRMEELNEFMEDVEDMARNVISDMSSEEKQAWKQRLNKMINM